MVSKKLKFTTKQVAWRAASGQARDAAALASGSVQHRLAPKVAAGEGSTHRLSPELIQRIRGMAAATSSGARSVEE